MKKDVIATIVGTQNIDGVTDIVEMVTAASFCNKNHSMYISYKESELTGFEGCTTTVKVEGSSRIVMLRSGELPTQLIIEKGRRHQCAYSMLYQNMMMGITGSSIRNTLSENGGELYFSYSIDMDNAVTSENTVNIKIIPVNAHAN